MILTPEQIQTLLSAAGVLGPHARIQGLANNGLATVLGLIPCTAAKIYFFEIIYTGRNPANGQGVVTRQRIAVHGDPAAPAALAAAVVNFGPATDMANPPVFTTTVVGTNLQLAVNNPVAGAPCDVEAIVEGPYISS